MPKVAKKIPGAKNPTPTKKSSANSITDRTKIVDTINGLNTKDKINIFERCGVGAEYLTCYMCGHVKPASEFYAGGDINCSTGRTRICRECAEKIAHNVTENVPDPTPPSKKSVSAALEYLDKPFINKVYDDAVLQAKEKQDPNSDVWTFYMYSINRFKEYQGLRWRDSDMMKPIQKKIDSGDPDATKVELTEDQKNDLEQMEINKHDVVQFMGYDPFSASPIEQRPRLYAMCVSYLDEATVADPFKLSSVVQIVKNLNDAEQLSDAITDIMSDPENIADNSALLSRLMDARSKAIATAEALAKDNGISLKYNENHGNGQNTLTGRIKKVTEERLRDGVVNAYDIHTCKGMQQVADITARACKKEFGWDEDMQHEVKEISRDLTTKALKERDDAKEKARILLQENKDLKEYMRSKGLLDDNDVVIEDK